MTDRGAAGSKVVLFKIHTVSDIDTEEYGRSFERMLAAVSKIPGFISIEGYSGEDGSELAVACFESDHAIIEWRDQPDHAATRERGRGEFFESYDITVASVERRYDWHR